MLKFKEKVFGSRLEVYHGCSSDKAIKKILKRHNIRVKADDSCGWSVVVDGTGFMWFKDLPTMAHELLHFTINYFNYVGIDISVKNQETMCYFYTYYFESIVDGFQL